MVPDIAVAFCAVVTKAVSHRARRDGYALFVADSDDAVRATRSTASCARRSAMARQVDGLLLLSPTMADDDLRALADAVPLVVINRELDGVPAVLMPSADGAVAAVEHLHALGHRRLAYLAGPDNYSNRARTAAFTAHLRPARRRRRRAGPLRADVLRGRACGGPRPGRRGDGRARLQRRRRRGCGRSARRPGRTRAARRSVVGFDDTSLASMITPRLTTVHLPMAQAGEVAMGLLVDVLQDRPPRTARSNCRRS